MREVRPLVHLPQEAGLGAQPLPALRPPQQRAEAGGSEMNKFVWLAAHLHEVEDQIRLVERRRGSKELLEEALLWAAEETLRAQGLTFG
jgi:hypothetical protein